MASAISAKELPKNQANHLISARHKLLAMLKYVVLTALSAFSDMTLVFPAKYTIYSKSGSLSWLCCNVRRLREN